MRPILFKVKFNCVLFRTSLHEFLKLSDKLACAIDDFDKATQILHSKLKDVNYFNSIQSRKSNIYLYSSIIASLSTF